MAMIIKSMVVALLTIVFFAAFGCYHLSIDSAKWQIKFDKKQFKAKKLFYA